MEFYEKLSDYFENKGISQVAIAEKLGVTKAYVNALLSGRKTFGKRQAKIWENHFGISKAWLLTGGEGEMLKDVAESETSDEMDNDSQEDIDIHSYREEETPKRFISYLVPMAAMGGSLIGFDEEGVSREDCEKVISPIADIDWVVPVCGDSMEPEYPNGSRVYVRKINPGDFISWGNVFVLDTTNGLIIKMVTESEKPGCVRCVSLNPSGRYAPFDVPMRAIRAMYRVILCVSVK